VVRDYFFEQVEPETVAAFERAVGELGRLGARVRDVAIPSMHAAPSFMVIMLVEAFAYHERDLREHPELYGDVLREKLMAGGLFRADEYVQAQRLRSQIREDTARVLQSVDLLVTPTALGPAPAFKVVLDPDFPFAKSNMGPFNVTGLPTLALPTGFSSTGLPLSFQISGRPFDEATVLRVGHAYQRATDWHRRRPPVRA
jgi:aspartyl-tRNA(Asn)/glutamyl-tRNA(Gln) amidotransferase subunit A